MAKLKKKKGFTLLELTLAAALFVSAMVGVIALVATSVGTINQTLSIQAVNSAARNINEYLRDEINNASCFTVPQSNSKQINILDKSCTNEVKTIFINKDGYLVSQGVGGDEIKQTSNNILISPQGKKEAFSENNGLLEVNLVIASNDENNISMDYATSFSGRAW